MKKTAAVSQKTPVILVPHQGDELSLQTDLQYRYACGKCAVPTIRNGWAEKDGLAECSYPEAVTVKWTNPAGKICQLLISETSEFSRAKKREAFRSCRVYNLLPGKQYFLKVRCGRIDSETVCFFTRPELPRFIYVPGVTNVRDIGGLSAGNGKKIRFGMVYRGAQHEKWSRQKGITKEGKRILLEDLKLKAILDLRGETEGRRVMEKDVRKYVKIPSRAYATWRNDGIFSKEQMDHIRKIFGVFAQKNSYPLYVHCQGGGDRTGTVAFLLEVVLGVSQEDAEKEYEFSNLSSSGIRLRSSEVWVRFMEKLETFAPGKSIRDKVTAFLYRCGVKEATLGKIRNILLEN